MKATEKIKAEMHEKTDEFLRAHQRALLEGVLEILEENAEMYHKILRNGHDIWIQTTDERWERIYKQRDKLWLKIQLINCLENKIIENYY